MSRFLSRALTLLLLGAAAVLHPAPLQAASLPIDIPVFSSDGASAAIDSGGRATIADAATGALDFVPVERFAFPNRASYLRQTVVWVRIPYDARWRAGDFSIETSFDAASASIYALQANGGWDTAEFGMNVPYADRAVSRIVPTARIPRGIGGALYLRLSYAKESRKLSIVNAAEIDREEAAANAQEPAQVFFIGVFVTLALTNLALFAFARSRMYLLYSAAMLLAAVNCGTLSYPYAWKWFWPHVSPPHGVTLALFGALVVTAIVFFTSELLKVRAFWPRVDRFLRVFAVVAAINGVAAELWYASAYVGPVELETIFRLLLFVPYGILIVSGIRAWRDGNPNASFVVAGYAFQAIGIALYLSNLWMIGESHSGFFTGIALSCDGLLLFAALAAQLEQIQREAAEQARAAAEQRRLALTDGLTGIANRRAYDEALSREWDRASRDGTALALVLFDVDFFKRYNDTYGHVAGDKCLQSVAAAAQSCVRRPSDLFARYGGEEFVALLPRTDASAAFAIAEAMCDAVRDLNIEHAASSLGVVSISAGVASTAAKPFAEPALPHAADKALYLAKEGGRNRVAAAGRVGGGSVVEARALHAAEE
jgi:diguanylate cyclase (GGDEF)-like protein